MSSTVHFRAKRMVTCHKGFILAAFRSLSQVASPPSACDISNWWSPPIFPALRAANPSALGTLSQAVTDPSAHPLCNFLSHVTSPSALRENVQYAGAFCRDLASHSRTPDRFRLLHLSQWPPAAPKAAGRSAQGAKGCSDGCGIMRMCAVTRTRNFWRGGVSNKKVPANVDVDGDRVISFSVEGAGAAKHSS